MFPSQGIKAPTWLPNPAFMTNQAKNFPLDNFGFINVTPSLWLTTFAFKGTDQEKISSYYKNQVYETITLSAGKYKEEVLTHRIAHVVPLEYVFPGTSTAWEYTIHIKVEHESCCTCNCVVPLVKGIARNSDEAMKHVDYHLGFFQFTDLNTAL